MPTHPHPRPAYPSSAKGDNGCSPPICFPRSSMPYEWKGHVTLEQILFGIPPPKKTNQKNDPASFDKEALRAIYGDYVHCIFTAQQADDFHHCYSRGQEFGHGFKSKKRKMFSSVFNAIPITRFVHDRFPLLNHAGVREALFSNTLKVVMNAVASKRYELTANDLEFLEWKRQLPS